MDAAWPKTRAALTGVLGLCLATTLSVPLAAPALAATPTCMGLRATLVGTAGSDDLRGTARRDVIVALAGNDRVQGLGGADVVCAGPGNDEVLGATGDDRLDGGSGGDTIGGGDG